MRPRKETGKTLDGNTQQNHLAVVREAILQEENVIYHTLPEVRFNTSIRK